MTAQYPIENAGLYYVNGLDLSAGTLNADLLSSAQVIIASGQARDAKNINDIALNSPVTINSAVNGVNGLDSGALAATTLYAVYLIADSSGFLAPAGLLSLNFAAPNALPYGYDSYRRVGAVLSNAAGTRILNFAMRGNGSEKRFWYAVPLATLVTAGGSATFAPVTLTTWVPPTAIQALLLSVLTADAGATRTVVYAADAGTTIAAAASAGEVIMSAPASGVVSASLNVPITNAAGVMTCQYAVSNASAAVAVSVQGYIDAL